MPFAWQLSADISGLTNKMNGSRPIARLGLIDEGKTLGKDELLKFVKTSVDATSHRCDIQIASSEADRVEILYRANTRLSVGNNASSGKALSQVRALIPKNQAKSLNLGSAKKAFFDCSFWNQLTEKFLIRHKAVVLDQIDVFPSLKNDAKSMELQEIPVKVDTASNVVFADISFGPSLLVWAVRRVASNDQDIRLLLGDIHDEAWCKLAAFQRASSINLKVPAVKEKVVNKPIKSPANSKRIKVGGTIDDLDLVELSAMYQSLQLARNECWFFELKKASHINSLISRVRTEIIKEIGIRFPPEDEEKDH